MNDGVTTLGPVYSQENSKLSGLLAPGEALTGTLTYEVAENATDLTLEMKGTAGQDSDYYGQLEYSLEF